MNLGLPATTPEHGHVTFWKYIHTKLLHMLGEGKQAQRHMIGIYAFLAIACKCLFHALDDYNVTVIFRLCLFEDTFTPCVPNNTLDCAHLIR